MILRQTAALFLDAYRELNAKRLFWFVLVISMLVVLAFAMAGINERGFTFLWFQFDTPITSEQVPPATLYKFIFASLAIPIWLTWIATILALISTAGIIPDFVASGSVELSLSKPLSGARLFLTKYMTGLLFVGLQVFVFSFASFLVIGFRGGEWEPRLFLAVPIILCFFSYLFCVCALIGLITRSTIASLLLTLLFWFVVFSLHTAESLLLLQRETVQLRIESLQRMSETLQRTVDRERAEQTPPASTDQAAPTPEVTDSGTTPAPEAQTPAREPTPTETALERRLEDLEEARDDHERMKTWHARIFALKTVLPKTSETVELLNRSLLSPDDVQRFMSGDDDGPGPGFSRDVPINQRKLAQRMEEETRSRTLGWVLGTSLLFEAVVLLIASVIFVRRDF